MVKKKKNSRFNFCSVGKTKKVVILQLVSKTAEKQFTISAKMSQPKNKTVTL